jgi:LysM domain
MRFLLFGLVVFAAGGLLGAALIRPKFISQTFLQQLWSDARGLGGRAQGLTQAETSALAPLPAGEAWGRVLIGSPALPPAPAPGSQGANGQQGERELAPGEEGHEAQLLEQGYLEAGGYLEPSPAVLPGSDAAAPETLEGIAPGGNLPPISSPDSAQPGYAEYWVRKGDTLTSICAGHYKRRERLLVEALARFNRLENPNDLELGQRISLPPLDLLTGE